MKKVKIGITERGDASFNLKWKPWVKQGNPTILITKQPEILVNQLVEIDNPNIIIHCTITGNGGTIMEPDVPPYKDSLDAYFYLVKKYGSNRVVLRIDPIIPVEPYLSNSYDVLNEAKQKLGVDMTRVRISIFDNYNHVKERMIKLGLEPFDFYFHAPLKQRLEIWNKMGKPELCGEPDMETTGCISEIDCNILGVEPIKRDFKQRTECLCLGNKQELLNDKKVCPSNCVYCYWKNKN